MIILRCLTETGGLEQIRDAESVREQTVGLTVAYEIAP
jgi:hypothetical protein